MKQKSNMESEVAATLKVVRSAVRAKHSIAADRELNEILPGIEAEVIQAAAAGKPYRVDFGALYADSVGV